MAILLMNSEGEFHSSQQTFRFTLKHIEDLQLGFVLFHPNFSLMKYFQWFTLSSPTISSSSSSSPFHFPRCKLKEVTKSFSPSNLSSFSSSLSKIWRKHAPNPVLVIIKLFKKRSLMKRLYLSFFVLITYKKLF